MISKTEQFDSQVDQLSHRHRSIDKELFLCVTYLFNAFDGCTMHNQAAFKKSKLKWLIKFKQTLQWSQFILNLNKHF